MSSSTGVYRSEPASPVLAHSMLSPSPPSTSTGNQSQPSHDSANSWNLRSDLEKGIECSTDSVVRTGTVIGLSRVRTRNRDDYSESIGQLARDLLCKHLQQQPSPSTSINIPTAFIIHPINFPTFTPEVLLASLLSTTTTPILSREKAIRHLDSVRLLPVFDLTTAAQSITKVSTTLDEIKAQRNPPKKEVYPVLLIIAGLDSLTEAVIRSSNPVKGTAMLAAVLRSLTRLTRVHSSFLSVLLVNVSGVGGVGVSYSSTLQIAKDRGTTAAAGAAAAGAAAASSSDCGVQSMFHPGMALFPSLLLRTLDQGVDTHLLMSTVQNVRVVEVIKDRGGGGTGKWCVWDV